MVALSVSIDKLSVSVASNRDGFEGSHLSSRRLIFIVTALAILFLVRWYIQLYRHNARWRMLLNAIADALPLQGATFSVERFERTLRALHPMGIEIGDVRSPLAEVLDKFLRAKKGAD